MTRCFKEDYFLIQTLIDIDLVETMIRFQLTIHTDQKSTLIKEMVKVELMEMEVAQQIMNQILEVVPSLILNIPNLKSKFLNMEEDSNTLMLMMTLLKFEYSIIRF